jgi:hypothetical protein
MPKGNNVMYKSSDSLSGQMARAYFRELVRAILDGVQAGHPDEGAFGQARLSPEYLPLTRADFSTAVNRLASARSYLRSGEPGAARFELRLLLASMGSPSSRPRSAGGPAIRRKRREGP